jgi:hypothetical protein
MFIFNLNIKLVDLNRDREETVEEEVAVVSSEVAVVVLSDQHWNINQEEDEIKTNIMPSIY